jgi:hypothetical protein
MPTDDFPRQLQRTLHGMGIKANELGWELPDYVSCGGEPMSNELIVYYVGEEFDTAPFTALAQPGTSVMFRRALLSRAQQEHLYQLVDELRPAFQAAGVQITGWAKGGDPSAIGFKVGYLPADAQLPTELVEQLEIYGPGTVTFTPGFGLASFTDR